MTTSGHNTQLNESEKQALWGHHVGKKVDLRRRMDDLKAEEKKLDADMKNDGFSKAEVKDFLDCMLSDDKQKKVESFNMLKRNRIRLGLIPDDRNADLLADRVTTQEMIFASGVEAGLAGLDHTSRYAKGSDEERAFLDGYAEGQRIARENLQSAMEKRNAAKATSANEAPAADGTDPFASKDD